MSYECDKIVIFHCHETNTGKEQHASQQKAVEGSMVYYIQLNTILLDEIQF